MAIKIDITGFYYEIEIDAAGVVTVADAMRVAAGQDAPNGGRLSVSSDINGFVNEITVRYPATAEPASRQSGARRPVGTYSYNDNPVGGGNVVPGGGDQDGQLAWQYYVRRGGLAVNNDRTIIAFDKSDSADGQVGPLQDGDVIIWRLVAIFGLRSKMQERNSDLLQFVADNGAMSMKTAMRVIEA